MAIGSIGRGVGATKFQNNSIEGLGFRWFRYVIICLWRPRDGSWWLLYMNM